MKRSQSVATRRDPLTLRVRERITSAMERQQPKMTQSELARRSGQLQQKIQRFLSGNMPYPPMSFLNDLASVFGWTLVELLHDEIPPLRTPAISDARVLEIADRLASADDRVIEAAQAWTKLLTARRPSGGSPRGPKRGPS